MLVFIVQVNFPPLHDGRGGPSLSTLGLVVVGACLGLITFSVFVVAVPRVRGAVRARRARRRRLQDAASAEARARAMMSELCPHGWQAQITMLADSDDVSPRVALDWTAFDGQVDTQPVIRRVWAATIAEALEAMVADRRTDETLEQIEQAAAADGTIWSDP